MIVPNSDSSEEEKQAFRALASSTHAGFNNHKKNMHPNIGLPIKRIRDTIYL